MESLFFKNGLGYGYNYTLVEAKERWHKMDLGLPFGSPFAMLHFLIYSLYFYFTTNL